MMTYPLVYILIWVVPTAVRIYQAVTGKAAPFCVATVDKVSYSPPDFRYQNVINPLLGMYCGSRLRRRYCLRYVISTSNKVIPTDLGIGCSESNWRVWRGLFMRN
jgi:hypothetical protein